MAISQLHLVRALAVSAALCGAWTPAANAAPTRVVFTVDVESNAEVALPDQLDTACEGPTACGLFEIVRMLGERGWAGTFFLDVYEHRPWGEAAMRSLAVRLDRAGQDVELHTHPHWVYDAARPAMHQYTLDEQVAIVADGVERLRSWTGRPVVAHRAGAYAADARTIEAIARAGIRIDSSAFWTAPESRLDALQFPHNLPARRGSITEIPVTVYERIDRPALAGALLPRASVVRKIDPNWFTTTDEMTRAIDAEVSAGVPILVVFLHSFSFIKSGAAGGRSFVADRHGIDVFAAILEHLANTRLPVVTMRQLADEPVGVPTRADDIVPTVTVPVGFATYVWRQARSIRAPLRAGLGLMVLAVCTALVVARRSRRPR
jgi:peptidoglycan/xylan/chitin deacetylase (PgdA/CDA1 family)